MEYKLVGLALRVLHQYGREGPLQSSPPYRINCTKTKVSCTVALDEARVPFPDTLYEFWGTELDYYRVDVVGHLFRAILDRNNDLLPSKVALVFLLWHGNLLCV